MDRVHSEYSRLFAYVDYEKAEEAEAAVDHMDGGEPAGTVWSGVFWPILRIFKVNLKAMTVSMLGR